MVLVHGTERLNENYAVPATWNAGFGAHLLVNILLSACATAYSEMAFCKN